MPTGQTIQQILARRAATEDHTVAYRFLLDTEPREYAITYGELDRQAQSIASELRRRCKPGDRAVLLYPPGLEFIAGFFGCLYAGVIAVPAYPPRNNSHSARIEAIVRDAEPRIGLTTAATLERLAQVTRDNVQLQALPLLGTDTLPVEDHDIPTITGADADAVAVLQYTSGSTGDPKGVMVTHGNMSHNLALSQERWQLTADSVFVSWLPAFHDMGLIAGILLPLYGGFTGVLMAPLSFLQRPIRWLAAISFYRATISVAPNFAYDLCARKIADADLIDLDISSWQQAITGAEPVRHDTMQRFIARFQPHGLRETAMNPGYGLAEATLVVSVSGQPQRYRTTTIGEKLPVPGNAESGKSESLSAGVLVGCGYGAADQEIIIVNPESRRPCAAGQIGEIWLAGPSVTKGYWRRPKETRETFDARLADTGAGPYLRTGDLGFLDGNELYVTGRLKDIIIVHGMNYYPQDIEWLAAQCHSSLRTEGAAAFSTEVEEEKQIVVLQEVEKNKALDFSSVAVRIRETIGEAFGLSVHSVVFVKSHSLPKTSSGKIQRNACRQAFLEDQLNTLWAWREAGVTNPAVAEASTEAPPQPVRIGYAPNSPTFKDWLTNRLAAILRVEADRLHADCELARYGLDSVKAAALAADIEREIGRPVPASLVFDYPTINAMARFVARGEETVVTGAHPPSNSREGIAIVGIGCRFPGANNPDAFWRLLRNGVDAIMSELPEQRRQNTECDAGSSAGTAPRYGGYLSSVDRFDAGFFEISPREAASMDPQQRLLLEVAWEALEHAAIPAAQLAGTKTGVFIGVSNFDYSLVEFSDPAAVGPYAATGTAHSIIANRLSYFLDLRGPSLVIDTACSSSLVAAHYACQSLLRGECDVAITGGVNLILRREISASLASANMLSPEGRCKTFDSKADGYVRGEGCGVVVLKRLSDAIADRNPVIAIIAGSAVNQDGRSNGLTAPNGPAQEAVIRDALTNAGISPNDVSYAECHGTGTPLGDPQEIQALRNVLDPDGGRRQTCIIGSVKTNIGHLEAAAGVAGLIKVALSLEQGEIPPHLHLQSINPHIRLDHSAFVIPTLRRSWPDGYPRRIAGVSSFGFGGTNAHVIVEDVEFQISNFKSPHPDRPFHLLTLSAKTEPALREIARRYAAYCEEHPDASVADLCYTANTGRTPFSRRLAVVVETLADVTAKLEAGQAYDSGDRGATPGIVFLFPGHDAYDPGLARELYAQNPKFRATIHQCDDLIIPHIATSLRDYMFGESRRVHQDSVLDPFAMFALELALAHLWADWGVHPKAVMGSGIGEYAAACVAGILDVRDAVRMLAARSQSRDDFAKIVAGIPSRSPTISFLSSITGDWIAKECPPDANYWLRHLQEPLRLADAASRFQESGCTHFLEIGPANERIRTIETSWTTHSAVAPEFFPSLRIDERDWLTMLTSLARLYCRGETIDWEKFDDSYSRIRLRLPTYPFDGQRHWTTPAAPMTQTSTAPAVTDGKTLAWQRITAGEPDTFAVSLKEYGLDRFASVRDDLNRLSCAYKFRFFQQLGFFSQAAAVPSIEALLASRGVQPQYHKLVTHWLYSLEQRHIVAIRSEGDGVHVVALTPVSDPSSADMAKFDSGIKVLAEYVMLFGERLSAIVTGATSPLEILFPGGSFAMSEKMYRDSSIAQYCNRMIRSVVDTWLLSSTQPGKFQLLEIGAGTGATTAAMLPRLPADRVHYVFSDVGEAFVHRGRQIFQHYPMTEFVVLDIENDPFVQGFELGCFDIVIAANVLHATRDLAKTLAHVTSLLRPDGLLILWEVTEHPEWFDTTFALIEGWRRFEDTDRRQDHPLLTLDQWTNLLAKCGFQSFHSFPTGRMDSAQIGQHVILAKRSPAASDHQNARLAVPPTEEVRERDDIFYQLTWVEANKPTIKTPVPNGSWLIFADSKGTAPMIADRLKAAGFECTLVYNDSARGQRPDSSISINWLAADDRAWLAETVVPRMTSPRRGILYLWGMEEQTPDASADAKNASLLGSACWQLITVIQSALTSKMDQQLGSLWVVTKGCQRIQSGSGTESFAAGALWGLGRVIAVESPWLWGGLVDLDPQDMEGSISALMAEILCPDDDDQLVFRNEQRYVARLQSVAIPAPAKTRSYSCHPDGTYLITGGLGGVGMLAAQWLVDRGARRLLLVGASNIPPRGKWKSVPQDATTWTKIDQIKRLEARGVSIHTAAVDVGDSLALLRLLKRFEREEWPPIKGIVHAAGRLEDVLIENLNHTQFETVFNPKVNGALTLHNFCRDKPLDFFILCSSAACVIAAPGGAGYAAANAFLGTLAQYRVSHGLPASCIHWGVIENTGLASKNDRTRRLISRGINPLRPAVVPAVLNAVLDHSLAECMVAAVDWERLQAGKTAARTRSLMSGLMPESAPGTTPGIGSAAFSTPPAVVHTVQTGGADIADVADFLVHQSGTFLQMDPSRISRSQPLQKYGFDSIMAVQLKNEIEANYGVAVGTASMVEMTVTDLANHIVRELQEKAARA